MCVGCDWDPELASDLPEGAGVLSPEGLPPVVSALPCEVDPPWEGELALPAGSPVAAASSVSPSEPTGVVSTATAEPSGAVGAVPPVCGMEPESGSASWVSVEIAHPSVPASASATDWSADAPPAVATDGDSGVTRTAALGAPSGSHMTQVTSETSVPPTVLLASADMVAAALFTDASTLASASSSVLWVTITWPSAAVTSAVPASAVTSSPAYARSDSTTPSTPASSRSAGSSSVACCAVGAASAAGSGVSGAGWPEPSASATPRPTATAAAATPTATPRRRRDPCPSPSGLAVPPSLAMPSSGSGDSSAPGITLVSSGWVGPSSLSSSIASPFALV